MMRMRLAGLGRCSWAEVQDAVGQQECAWVWDDPLVEDEWGLGDR